ncbi:unnamed protein product [Cuscuta epithymum]|uniref:Bromo domain-containing protein n=1 Tax=Cuscuta epithymum TaxID=186058 RepID=A0AAV0EV79_9ASTE|nr:unnamed protein product [Cuscuta epithymum]
MQGFTEEIKLEKDRWEGMITKYNSTSLMEFNCSSFGQKEDQAADENTTTAGASLDTEYKALHTKIDRATNQKNVTDFLRSLLKSMYAHVDAGAFKEVAVGNDPIDLKIISERVESGQYYEIVEVFACDVRRMLANIRTLYALGSMHSICASRFEKYFTMKLNCEYIL